MSETRLELLKAMPIFGAVSDRTLTTLLELSQGVSIAEGEFFFRQGEQGQCLYVLEKGRVAVVKESEGKQYTIRQLGTGDAFGEMALIDLFPRSASVRALEDCQALELTQDALYTLYEKDLEQFTIIHMNMGRELSRRLRDSDEKVFRAGINIANAYEDLSFRTL